MIEFVHRPSTPGQRAPSIVNWALNLKQSTTGNWFRVKTNINAKPAGVRKTFNTVRLFPMTVKFAACSHTACSDRRHGRKSRSKS